MVFNWSDGNEEKLRLALIEPYRLNYDKLLKIFPDANRKTIQNKMMAIRKEYTALMEEHGLSTDTDIPAKNNQKTTTAARTAAGDKKSAPAKRGRKPKNTAATLPEDGSDAKEGSLGEHGNGHDYDIVEDVDFDPNVKEPVNGEPEAKRARLELTFKGVEQEDIEDDGTPFTKAQLDALKARKPKANTKKTLKMGKATAQEKKNKVAGESVDGQSEAGNDNQDGGALSVESPLGL